MSTTSTGYRRRSPLWRGLRLTGFGLAARLGGSRRPLLASVKLSYACNLSCQACPFHGRAGTPGSQMSWATAVSTLESLKASGVQIVIFEGGEPLMWRDGGHDFNELARLARSLFTVTGVTTNGTLALDAPTDLVWVSVDGPPAIHDELRSSSFARLSLNLAAARHPKILAHLTVSRANFEAIPATVAELGRYPAVRGVTFQFFYPYGQGEADLGLSLAERRRAVEIITSLKGGPPVMNSPASLKRLIANDWTCHAWLLTNADPDGSISQGCYVKSRGAVDCRQCGFSPVAEASRAFDLHAGALLAGWRIFVAG
jgi:MoaA/NifB/PqqE/SkfB family radical SAM enzyme